MFPMGHPQALPMAPDPCSGPAPLPRDGFFGNLAMTKRPGPLGSIPPGPRMPLLPLLGEMVAMDLEETSKHGKQYDNFLMFLTLTMQAVRRALLKVPPGQAMRVQDLPANVERHVGTTFEKSRLGLQDLKDLVSLLGLFPDVFEVDASASGGPVVSCRAGGNRQVQPPDEKIALMLWQRSKDLQPRLDCLATYRTAREASQRGATQSDKDEEGAPPWRATAAARGKSSSAKPPAEEAPQAQKRPAETLTEPAAKRPPALPQGVPETVSAAKPPPAKAPWQPPTKASGPPPPPPPAVGQPPAKAPGSAGEPSLAALLAAVEEVEAQRQGAMTPARAPITKQPPTQEQWMRMQQPADASAAATALASGLAAAVHMQQHHPTLPTVSSQGAAAPPQGGQQSESLMDVRAQEKQLDEQLRQLEQQQQLLSQQQMQLMHLERDQDALTPLMQTQLQQHTVELWNQQKLLADQKVELRAAQQKLAENLARHSGAGLTAGQPPSALQQMPPQSMWSSCLQTPQPPAPPNPIQQLLAAGPSSQQPPHHAPPPPPPPAAAPLVPSHSQQQGQDGQLSLSQLLQGYAPVGSAPGQQVAPQQAPPATTPDLTAALLSALPGGGLGSSCAQVAPPTQQLQQQMSLQQPPQAPSILTPQMIQVQQLYQATLQR